MQRSGYCQTSACGTRIPAGQSLSIMRQIKRRGEQSFNQVLFLFSFLQLSLYDAFDGDRKYYRHISEEYLIKCGYQIRHSPIANGGKEVWSRAYVEVSLGYKSAIGNGFDTDQEAKDWIDKLKEMSGKTFEVITH